MCLLLNLDNDGTGDESTLVKRHPNDSEFLDLDSKIGKSGTEEVAMNPLFWISSNLIMIIFV